MCLFTCRSVLSSRFMMKMFPCQRLVLNKYSQKQLYKSTTIRQLFLVPIFHFYLNVKIHNSRTVKNRENWFTVAVYSRVNSRYRYLLHLRCRATIYNKLHIHMDKPVRENFIMILAGVKTIQPWSLQTRFSRVQTMHLVYL